MHFPITTFGLPLKGTGYTECHSVQALQEAIDSIEGKTFIVGGGSNLLPLGYVNAHIIHPAIQSTVYEDLGDEVYVTAGAGVNWHGLVLETLAKGFSGLENLSLIPGQVGAAPIQNIGAYGVELAERVVEVECLDLHSNEMLSLSNDECDFAYRDSIFKHEMKGRVIITAVTLRLDKSPRLNLSYGGLAESVKKMTDMPTAQDVSNAVVGIRKSKLPDPKEIGNAGSFFKNPVIDSEHYAGLKDQYPDMVAYVHAGGMKLAAGWLIDQCGLKGYRHKATDAGVHDQQALVIVNRGSATGEDILEVAAHVQRTVYQQFSIQLHPEVQIVGDKEKIQRSGLLFA